MCSRRSSVVCGGVRKRSLSGSKSGKNGASRDDALGFMRIGDSDEQGLNEPHHHSGGGGLKGISAHSPLHCTRDVRQVLRKESGEMVGIKNEEQHFYLTLGWMRR